MQYELTPMFIPIGAKRPMGQMNVLSSQRITITDTCVHQRYGKVAIFRPQVQNESDPVQFHAILRIQLPLLLEGDIVDIYYQSSQTFWPEGNRLPPGRAGILISRTSSSTEIGSEADRVGPVDERHFSDIGTDHHLVYSNRVSERISKRLLAQWYHVSVFCVFESAPNPDPDFKLFMPILGISNGIPSEQLTVRHFRPI